MSESRRAPHPARRRSTGRRDLLVIAAMSAVAFSLGVSSNLFGHLHRELDAAPGVYADAVIGAIVILVIAAGSYAVLRGGVARTEQALRAETDRRYQAIVEQQPAITYTWDPSAGPEGDPTLYVSPQIESLLGYTPEEWLAVSDLWIRLLHPDDRDRVIEASRRSDREGVAFREEYRTFTKDGRVVWVRDESEPVARDREGRPTLMQGVIYDITAQKEVAARLLEAEERYRTLVEQLPAVVYIDAVDEMATALYVSPQYERLTGYTPTDRLAEPGLWLRMLHPDDRVRVLTESDRVNETGEPFDIEYRLIRADGEVVWVHDHAFMVDLPGGRSAWQGVLTDVTERQAALDALGRRDRVLQATAFAAERFLHAGTWEDALDEVLSRLGQAVDASRAYVFRNDGDGADVTLSQCAEWVAAGVTPMVDDPANQAFPHGDGFQRWQELLSTGQVVHGPVATFPDVERDDADREGVLSLCVVPIRAAGGWWGFMGFDDCDEPRAWTGAEIEALRVAADTLGAAIGRQRGDRRLAEAEERFRAIVEHVPSVIYLDAADASMQTIYISPQVEEITGISPDEWIADPDAWREALDPEDHDRVLHGYLAAVNAGEPWSDEYRMHTRDGRQIWVHDETTFLKDDDGSPTFMQGVISDITQRKLAEQGLRESEQREREAAERLRALDEMKNTFLAAVSHELRSPLTSILGLSLTLERTRDLSAVDRDDLLVRLSANARKLDRLLKDLLDIDRLNRGIVEPAYRTTDVGALAERTLQSLDALGDRIVLAEVESVVLRADPAKVERIVENLLMNAARHTTRDRCIWLRVAQVEGGGLIAVEDDGPGVPDELRTEIFEAFRQGPTASPHSPGTGIGLSLVARFAELHGGRAWVQERDGGGASFRVFLPDAPDATHARPDEPLRAVEAG